MADLTASEAEKIRYSFSKVITARESFSKSFYDRLFTTAPSTRLLFSTDMDTQREKLVATLAYVVRSVNSLDSLRNDIRELGRRHVEYGIIPGHYVILRDVFLDTIAEYTGDEFDAETRHAWAKLYDIVADEMTAAGPDTRGG